MAMRSIAGLEAFARRKVTGALFTVDLINRDIEVKLLIGCTPEEMQTVHRFQNSGPMAALLLTRAGDSPA